MLAVKEEERKSADRSHPNQCPLCSLTHMAMEWRAAGATVMAVVMETCSLVPDISITCCSLHLPFTTR